MNNIIGFVVFTLLPLFSFAKVYYVSNSGNDSNNGESPDQPWKTISKVNSVDFQPGDSILFWGGDIFDGNLYFDVNDGNDSQNPITISSYGNLKATINASNSYGVFIYNSQGFNIENINFTGNGSNSNTSNGMYFYNDLEGDTKLSHFGISNCEISGFFNGISIESSAGNSGFNSVQIDNCTIYNCIDNGIRALGYFSVEKMGYSHSNIEITECEVFDIMGINDPNSHSGNGIVLSNVQYGLIENCTVYNCGVNNVHCGGPIGIWFWDSDQVTIQFCEAYNISAGSGCDGGGFDLDGGVTNGVMQYNYSHDNDGSGFLVGQFAGARAMDNIIVRYNISENDAKTNGGSIALFNLGATKMNNILTYNNTLFSNHASPIIFMYDFNPLNGTIEFHNNILYANGDGDLINVPRESSAHFMGNLYFSTDAFKIQYQGATYNSLIDFRNTNNELFEGNSLGYQGNPLLVNAGNGRTIGHGNPLSNLEAYQLTTSSPAINAGFNIDISDTQDFFGNFPIVNGKRDIGAHEFNGTLMTEKHSEQTDIKIYTNINGSELVILSEELIIHQVQLIDIKGRVITYFEQDQDLAFKKVSLNLSGIKSGIYLLNIKTSNKILVKKFIHY